MERYIPFLERSPQKAWGRYSLALGAVAVALLVRRALDPFLGDSVPFLFLFPAVALSAVYAGFGPAMLAATVGLLATIYIFIQPRYSLLIAEPEREVAVFIFLISASLIAIMGELTRSSRAKLRLAVCKLEQSEESLRKNAELLEARVADRTAELEHTSLQFKRAEQAARRLSGRLLLLEDAERRKFARGLHDSLGQQLAALRMNLDMALHDGTMFADKGKLLTQCSSIVDQCLTETRTVSHLLHPPFLEETGLASAVRGYVEGFARRSGIQANLSILSELPRLSSDVETAVFRALQEGLTNAHRHSGSSRVDIVLTVDAGCVKLQVKDYGRGIPGDVLRNFRDFGGDVGVGLGGMRERARELGGSLDIESSEASGTTVTLTILAPHAAV